MKKQPPAPPSWVALLAATACDRANRRVPTISWYKGRSAYSSGHCSVDQKRLHITAGTSMIDQQFVVLHELAHYLTINRQRTNGRRSWHNKRFHERLMQLITTYGDDAFVAYCVQRESEYMKRAAAVMKPS